MPTVVVVGGSVSGLVAALALSQRGHRVHVVERDPRPLPETIDAAHEQWRRPTVPQAVHSHSFTALGTLLLRDRAPQLHQALLDAGATEVRLTDALPPTAADREPQPGDDALVAMACRRSTYELVLAQVVLAQPGVTARRGVVVRGLAPGDPGRPVTGVRTEDGTVIPADIVIDATGRAAMSRRWLADAGLPVATDLASPSEATFYTRYYRRLGDRLPGPLNRGNAAGGVWEHYGAVLHPGDNRTFTVIIGVLPDDQPMRRLREEPAFTAAVRATPLLAPWVAGGASEPISGVNVMRSPDNALYGPATTRQEPVPGLYPVGDAACVTNPAFGRGVSLAIAHAYDIADQLTAHPEVDAAQGRAVAAATERLLKPWYEQAVRDDEERIGVWRTHVHGAAPTPPPPGRVTFAMASMAAATDGVVWRRLAGVLMCLAPPATLFDNDEMRVRVATALQKSGPLRLPGPTRDELVHAVTGAEYAAADT